jgi:hypothetical protein
VGSLNLDRFLLFAAAASIASASLLTADTSKASPKPKPNPVAAAKPAAPKPAASPAAAVDAAQGAKVIERATDYWKTRMSMNLQSILPFYESSFRTSLTPEKFAVDYRRLNRFAPEFLGIDGVRFESPTRAVVKVKLRTKPAMLDGAELVTSTDETWVLENGQWFKVGESMIPNI